MKIVVAPQAFKGSLGAFQACDAINEGIRQVFPQAEVCITPMADGGDGTLEVLVHGTGGRTYTSQVTGPLGQPVEALWGVLGNGRTVMIEMARASGLALVPREQRNPLVTTTRGTGELIRNALDAGYREFILGVGGSATCDGGAGMAQALGARLLDAGGGELPAGGAALGNLASVDISDINPHISESRFNVASDVTNPLCGPEGSAAIYGPQKGATPSMVKELDQAMNRFAEVIERDVGLDLKEMPGAGAAGGLAYGMKVFLDADVRPGVDLVAEATGLEERLRGADLVISGEGQLDGQTAYGKTIMGVSARARALGVPVLALAGGLAPEYQTIYEHGVASVMSITPRPMPLDVAIEEAYQLVAEATERALRMIDVGMKMRPNTREG